MSVEWDGPLPLHERYPDLDKLDYQSINEG